MKCNICKKFLSEKEYRVGDTVYCFVLPYPLKKSITVFKRSHSILKPPIKHYFKGKVTE